jgi:hypothetical protein
MTLTPRPSDRSRWYLSISESAGNAPASADAAAALKQELYEGRAWFGRGRLEQIKSLSEAQICARRIATLVLETPKMAICHTLQPHNTLPLLRS